MGAGLIKYRYSLKELYKIKKANIYWKIFDLLACKLPKLAKIYNKTIGKAYRVEREKFSLQDSKNILHIGCGSYPITAMVLAEMDDVNIVTIDNKDNSIKQANEIIKKYDLNDRITAKKGDGTKYPLDKFDTIIVSGCSFPKIQVLEHVFKNAKPDSRIIVRDSFLDMDSIINSINPGEDITVKKKIGNYTIYDK